MIETAISFWADIKRYEDMLEADPRSYCFAPLSELYRKLGLVDDAISVARKGTTVHPDYAGGFLALASALLDKGFKEEAREALERVVAANPENLRGQKLLSQIYADAGETTLAKEALRRVLQENPDDAESAVLLRTISSAAGDGEDAVEECLEEVELVEELTDELEPEELFEADELFELEEPAHPEALSPSAAATGKDPLSTATMAELYLSQGFPEKALRIYRALLEDDPANLIYSRRAAELDLMIAGAPDEGWAPVAAAEPAAAVEEAPAAALEEEAPFPFLEEEEPFAVQEETPSAAADGSGTENLDDSQLRTVEILDEWLENIKRRKQHAL